MNQAQHAVAEYETTVLTVDGQDIIVVYCPINKVIAEISIVTPLVTVRLSNGFCIECEQGQVYVNNAIMNAVTEFAQAEDLEL